MKFDSTIRIPLYFHWKFWTKNLFHWSIIQFVLAILSKAFITPVHHDWWFHIRICLSVCADIELAIPNLQSPVRMNPVNRNLNLILALVYVRKQVTRGMELELAAVVGLAWESLVEIFLTDSRPSPYRNRIIGNRFAKVVRLVLTIFLSVWWIIRCGSRTNQKSIFLWKRNIVDVWHEFLLVR